MTHSDLLFNEKHGFCIDYFVEHIMTVCLYVSAHYDCKYRNSTACDTEGKAREWSCSYRVC